MSPSSTFGQEIEPAGAARPVGRGRVARTGLRRSAGAARRHDLEIVATTLVGMAAVLSGPLVWVAGGLLLAAMLLGTLQVLAADDEDRLAGGAGIPIESLILPAVAAIGCLGAIQLVPLGLALIPAPDDRSMALVTTLVVALVAFVGVAAIVPGGIAGLEPVGAPAAPLPLGNLLLLGLADAFIAGLLGYRAAALRATNLGEALWSALTYGVAIAIGAAAIRAMGIPRLVGPALLMFVFYLWDVLHGTTPARRRDPRWIWQTALLAGLGALVALWNLRLVG
jgi:hypothetical protein